MIVLDVWGGIDSQTHYARYLLRADEALTLARTELDAGYLVNLRQEVAWGGFLAFDDRIKP